MISGRTLEERVLEGGGSPRIPQADEVKGGGGPKTPQADEADNNEMGSPPACTHRSFRRRRAGLGGSKARLVKGQNVDFA